MSSGNASHPRGRRQRRTVVLVAAAAVLSTLAAAGASGSPGLTDEVTPGWLLRQAELEVLRATGSTVPDPRHWQTDIGGSRDVVTASRPQRTAPVVPMLMSLVLPGAGEAYLGHKRGFFMMALDIASWYGVAHNADQGRKKRDEYYAFADAHWFEEKLNAAYDIHYLDHGSPNYNYTQVVGVGTEFFSVNGFTSLPLWVSAADDRREYYENLGKWDQFVFGWDDFADPRDFLGTSTIDIANLKDPRTSANREIYRQIRQDSNDAFARRDRFIYLSLGLRVVSVLQVAYLEGLLGGGGNRHLNGPQQLELGGHRIDLIVEPVGLSRGVLAAAVSF